MGRRAAFAFMHDRLAASVGSSRGDHRPDEVWYKMTAARSRPFAVLAPSCLLAGFCLFWFSDTIADPDLWGHVRFGQDILRTGSIARVDAYSYRTGGQVWFNHEWLCEAIFAGIYNAAGPRGLIVCKVLVSLLIVGLCHAHLRLRGLGPYASVILLLLVSIPFRLGLGTIRPQIFTYLLFLIELLLIERAAEGRTHGLWALPVVFAAWVNLHGGVLAGAGILGLWIAVSAVERLRDASGGPIGRLTALVQMGILGIACGLALLINPYGAELIRFLLRTATVPRPEISEWTPLVLMSLPGQFYLGLLAIGILGLAGSRRRRAGGAPDLQRGGRAPAAFQPALSALRDDARRPGGRAHRRRMGCAGTPSARGPPDCVEGRRSFASARPWS